MGLGLLNRVGPKEESRSIGENPSFSLECQDKKGERRQSEILLVCDLNSVLMTLNVMRNLLLFNQNLLNIVNV